MAHIVFVHGLDNKPESGYLHQLWKRKLGHDNGLDLDANGVSGSMVYWADVFYPEPDTNLAAYEHAAGDIELCGGPLPPWAADAGSPEELARIRRLAERCGVDLSSCETALPDPKKSRPSGRNGCRCRRGCATG